jgi:hypothetical protein
MNILVVFALTVVASTEAGDAMDDGYGYLIRLVASPLRHC